MGLKAFSFHYHISHLVHRRDEQQPHLVSIGSTYVPDALVFNAITGEFKVWNDGFVDASENLTRYRQEILADLDKARSLLAEEDQFKQSIPVWRVDPAGNLCVHHCEKLGWPNVTHEGLLMYESKFFPSPEEAIAYNVSRLKAEIGFNASQIVETEKKLEASRVELQQLKDLLSRLENLQTTTPNGPN